MSKNRLIITILSIFLLVGTISLAMGATSNQQGSSQMDSNMETPTTGATANVPDGAYLANVTNVGADNQFSGNPPETASGAFLTLTLPSGNQANIFAKVRPGSEEVNMYTTLNSAFVSSTPVIVKIQKRGNDEIIQLVVTRSI